jgi:hypothetical protein
MMMPLAVLCGRLRLWVIPEVLSQQTQAQMQALKLS